MNREIKFRVWAGKKFLYSYKGMGLAFSASRKDSDMEAFGCYDLQQCLEFGFVLQQFTGLLDKNGKEIFEGDIVKSKTEKGNVIFRDGSFRVDCGDFIFSLLYFGDFGKYTESVGNIFENPELLNK